MNSSRYTLSNGFYREVIDGVVRVEVPKQSGMARWWHANGRLAREVRLVNGLPEGICWEWHENGALAREIPYTRGFVDGVVKQWSTDGRLLGTYEMQMGRGTACEWNDDGSLKVEKEIIASGCEHDRVWSRSGIKEIYIWKDHVVSRKEYLDQLAECALAA
jgi:antitoxin component YwqK of YwqJK toxin-antitoxin module